MEVWQISIKVKKVPCMAQSILLMLSACSHTTSCRTHVNYIFTWLIFQECILNCTKPQEREFINGMLCKYLADKNWECVCRCFMSESMACWQEYNRYICYDTYLHVYHYIKKLLTLHLSIVCRKYCHQLTVKCWWEF